ncbi:MAG: response regulator, partial [Sulfurimonadaceae bacterium]|nr:response regulator [Sulfurimonadaceae bacterium]
MEINVVKLKEYAVDCRVLYVEDEEVIRTQTANFLGRFFPSLDLAENGDEGLKKYREGRYDIVITDINMPIMNGIEMIRNIRETNPEQIILVTSAYNDSDNLMNLINLGVMRFVLKPFDNKQFIIMLYQIVEGIHFRKAHELMQQQAQEAQQMIDMVNNGIVLIKEGVVTMANHSFLEMIGFKDFKTLQIEMPEIGVIFQTAEHSVDAQTNSELIEQLKITPEEDHKAFIDHDGTLKEYQITYTQIDERNDYVLVFTDITAIQEAMNRDEHTNLPFRKHLLDRIESASMTTAALPVMLVSVRNFNNVMQWYGKADAIVVEKETSQLLQSVLYSCAPKAFAGYFGQNQFVVIPERYDPAPITEKLLETVFTHLARLKDSHNRTDLDFHLRMETLMLDLD